jgi:hypothetical protein
MNKKELKAVWQTVSYTGKGEFEYRVLSENSKPSICVGYNRNQKSLILELPSSFKCALRDHKRENISFKFLKNENCLCIILEDTYFEDLFEDLTLSIYQQIKDIDSPDSYSSEFNRYFLKWSAFFEGKRQDGLTESQLKGLFGELYFVRELLVDSLPNINEILSSWRGPYDEGHDYVTEIEDIEIKTIDQSRNNVNISSEFQLDSEEGKTLRLLVYSVETNSQRGENLSDIISSIKAIILSNNGDLAILLNALAQKGLIGDSLAEYDSSRFYVLSRVIYNCFDKDFPKLTRSTLSSSINQVRYSLRLNLIEEFKTSEKEY